MDSTQTTVTISNKALGKIGAKLITGTNLGDTTQPNAVIVNNIYNQCLYEVLEEHPWSFAVSTITPIALTTLIPLVDFGDGIINPFQVPSDYLSIYLINQPIGIRFETLKSPYVTTPTYAMIAGAASFMIKYIFKQTDPTQYTSKFIEALACRIAYECCFKISEAAQYAAGMKTAYAEALMSATSADDKSSVVDQPIADEWLWARLAGSSSWISVPGTNVGFYGI